MNRLLKTTVIQDELILNYKNYNLTDEEFICICKLLTFDPLHINLASFLTSSNISKQIINNLVNKNVIKLIELDNSVAVDLTPLYEKITNENNSEIGLTSTQIEKLNHILATNLTTQEVKKINLWMYEGIKYAEIEEAVYTALSKGIKELNYIHKIIMNKNSEIKRNENVKVTRNWTY